MKMEFCRFRDFAVPLLGLSTRHPSIHEMRAIQLVDSRFRAPYLPDAAGAGLCLDRTIYFEENKFCPAINQRFVPEQNVQAKNAINVRFPSIA
jgi:hypothetical protein